ncbi:MAG: hypothetical protein FWE22_05335 [Firmicutes bacterium]|nr:hypothetical protein [Bacillota bacterium]
MSTVSGTLHYDGNRTAAVATATAAISNVPIVLQDTISGNAVAVLTDSTGAFSFTGVPNGSYQVVESYGFTFDGVTPISASGTVDWIVNQVAVMLNGGTVPPLSDNNHTYVSVPPVSSITHLDCTVRNTYLETVTGNITGINFLNGPVRYTPLVLDPNIIVDLINLVAAADNGTFGSFSAGTVANTGAGSYPANQGPYPEIQSQFLYSQPQIPPTSVTPNDGHYTVQNIMNNSWSNFNPSSASPAWWRVADKTMGNEMGRMMVINGYTAGYVIGQTTVTVLQNTNYLTSYWILNLCRQSSGYIPPEFSVNILDSQGNIIYQHNFTDEIGVNTECPEWIQIGTIFNSGDNTSVTIVFISEGGPQTGNDYVLDDVALNKVDILELNITKDVSCSYATQGGTLYYSITIINPTDFVATQIVLTDDLSDYFDDLEFTLDGENWDEWTGMLNIDDMQPNEEGQIIIRGKVKEGIGAGTILKNSATVVAVFCEVDEI